MSYANEVRKKVAHVLLTIGASLLLINAVSNSPWAAAFAPLGAMLLALGAVMYASLSFINGVPWLMRLISRHTEPVWHGELIHTDGGMFRIRYEFDEQGSPWFVAGDICVAVGKPVPDRDERRCAGVPLVLRGEHPCFSETDVQAYLGTLVVKNHEASRLLTIIRNEVLRKLARQREGKALHG